MSNVPFPRPLTLGDSGIDVEGVGRALCKTGYYVPLIIFNRAPESWRRTYGQRKVDAVNKLRKAEGWRTNGVYNEPVKYRLQDDERLRTAIEDFTKRSEQHESMWHYTQHRPFGGFGVTPEREHYNDCSSYVILTYHWARSVTNLPVPDPSGYAYKGWGNTWDDLDSHPRVGAPYLPGDLAHYEGHVSVCRKAGTSSTAIFSSFGREAGPEKTALGYRSDLRFVCRPSLLA